MTKKMEDDCGEQHEDDRPCAKQNIINYYTLAYLCLAFIADISVGFVYSLRYVLQYSATLMFFAFACAQQ
jgi:hypothetical protein